MSGNWPEVDRRGGPRRADDRRGNDRRAGDRRAGGWAARHRRTYIGLFLFVVTCIVYSELYPFRFAERIDDIGAVVFLLRTAGDWSDVSNLAASILLYAPFAYLAMFVLPLGVDAQLRAMMTVGAGILLSVWLELAQYQDAEHVTTMADVYANCVGVAISIALALIAQKRRFDVLPDLGQAGVPVLLLIMWLGDRLYPYVPAGNGAEFWRAFAPALDWSGVDPVDLARASVRWLMVACLLDSILGMRRWLLVFPLLVLVEFGMRVTLIGRVLVPPDVCGAAVALLLWPALRWLPVSRFVVLLAFAALVIVVRLAPFHFMGIPNSFGWLPFKAIMDLPTPMAVRRVFSDGFLYGGLIWLLTLGGVRVGGATALTAVLLLLLGLAQSWQPGPPGEITDAVVALAIGGVLALLQGDGQEMAERA